MAEMFKGNQKLVRYVGLSRINGTDGEIKHLFVIFSKGLHSTGKICILCDIAKSIMSLNYVCV